MKLGRLTNRQLVGLLAGVLAGCGFSMAQGQVAKPSPVAPQASRLNNVGTALMNQQQIDRATAKFTEAFRLDPAFSIAKSNEGIAYFYMQQNEQAEKALEAALALSRTDPHTWYALGLVYRAENKLPEALAAFRKVLDLDAFDPDTLYMTGSLLVDMGQFPAAEAEFQKALAKSPMHGSALFALARVQRKLGRAEDSQSTFARFKQLSAQKTGALISHAYGEEGVYSHTQESLAAPLAAPPMIPVRFVPLARSNDVNATSGMCLLSLGGKDRLLEVVLTDGGEALHLFELVNAGGTSAFRESEATAHGLAVPGRGLACAAGDYDNDGRTDLAVAVAAPSDGVRLLLFHNDGGGHFHEAGAFAGLTATNDPSALLFVDFDHDGDLDLFITGKPRNGTDSANALWRNDGNGRFTQWTAESELGGDAATTASLLSDLDNDRAVDLVTTGDGRSPDLYMNRREGAFQHKHLYDTALPPTNGVAILDFDKDGWMDVLVTHNGAPGATLWRNLKGAGYVRVPLPLPGVVSATAMTPIDFDNDGWIDLALLVTGADSRQELRMLRNTGPTGFVDVSPQLGLDQLALHGARKLVAADIRGSGAADLLVSEEGKGLELLANMGGNRHHSLPLMLTGLADNKSAIGTKVEVSVDGLPQKFEITTPAPLLVGLGSADSADYVRLLWPTGVPQDEIGALADKTLAVSELDRRGSSCPTLFAWDGDGYRFVTDVIGAGVIGHWIAPGKHNSPDADEWVKVDGEQAKEADGHISLRFGEPMEEVNFLDQVRLVAVDHPKKMTVVAQEAFLSKPPFASGAVLSAALPRPLAGAWDDRHHDVLALLTRRDLAERRYVRDFTNLPFAGFANTHSLTLDLGAWKSDRPLRLLLHGFIEYFSASSMYAAWQAGLAPVPPYIEAQMEDGSWKRVVDDMGFPAGLPRTVVSDLTGKLPKGTRLVRITTNLQIYWDQALIDNEAIVDTKEAKAAASRNTELPLTSARLAFRGYPQQVDGRTPGDLTYNYQQISHTGPFLPHRGSYTRYGDVTPLLDAVDDEFVIFGTGEDMDLEFATAALPALKQGWKRDYFFYANGYVKDMDFYEADPFEVGPLPFHAMSTYPYPVGEHYPDDPQHMAYQLNYNSRYESGSAMRSFQSHFVPVGSRPELPAPLQRPSAPR